MTEEIDFAQAEDVELIVDFLNGHLAPDVARRVRARLDDDAAFQHLAEPLLIAWQVKPHLQRHPRPAGELEREWDKLTKRLGFIHQKRKVRNRRLWILALTVVALGAAAFAARHRIREAWRDWRDYEDVGYTDRWQRLPGGAEVLMSPGAKLRAFQTPAKGNMEWVELVSGTVRFRALPPDTAKFAPIDIEPLGVRTPSATIGTIRGEFSVTVLGDTTVVEKHTPARQLYIGMFSLPTLISVSRLDTEDHFQLENGKRVRVIKGRAPETLP
jgi:ferric-dicitrate binding protein FerR (iron transport regulator)